MDLAIFYMVDLSSSLCKRLPEGFSMVGEFFFEARPVQRPHWSG